MSARRDFLSRIALGSLGVAGLTAIEDFELHAQQAASHWDLGWARSLKGKYRAVFDIPDIEDGFGVWRAVLWRKQYSQVFGVPEESLATVLVLRSDAVALALNHEFWGRYEAGKHWKVNDPSNGEPTVRNPVFQRVGQWALPAQFTGFTLDALLQGGAIVLACTMALRDCAKLVAEKDNVSMDEADRRVHAMLIPGITVQPSGIFAAVLAQDNGCRYVRAT